MASSPLLLRRGFLASAAASACLAAGRARARAADPTPVRRILAIGGGTLNSVDRERRILRFVLALTGRPTPTICMLPTASGDSAEQIVTWYEIAHGLDCRPRHVRLFGAPGRVESFERPLLEADAIFVSGGNTLNMLGVWRDQGIDAVLRRAWERGTVLAGESAGMNCWFEHCVTDSRPGGLTAMSGLGWLAGSVCPHYNNPQRRPAYHAMLQAGSLPGGIACDDGAAALYEGTTLSKAVAISESAKTLRVGLRDGEVFEDDLPAELLPPPS